MNDLQGEEIIKRTFHFWHRPVDIRVERHPSIRGLYFHYRICRICGKSLKMKVTAE